MGVDHRRADVPVAQQLLDGANVVAVLPQVGGERVPEGVARGGLGDPGAADRLLHRPLKDGFVEMVTATLAGDAVHVDARGREDPLPSPGSARVRVLAEERAGQLDPAGAVPEVVFVLPGGRCGPRRASAPRADARAVWP